MFIVLLICDELESVGDKDSASENRGKSEKKKKRECKKLGREQWGTGWLKCGLCTQNRNCKQRLVKKA